MRSRSHVRPPPPPPQESASAAAHEECASRTCVGERARVAIQAVVCGAAAPAQRGDGSGWRRPNGARCAPAQRGKARPRLSRASGASSSTDATSVWFGRVLGRRHADVDGDDAGEPVAVQEADGARGRVGECEPGNDVRWLPACPMPPASPPPPSAKRAVFRQRADAVAHHRAAAPLQQSVGPARVPQNMRPRAHGHDFSCYKYTQMRPHPECETMRMPGAMAVTH